MGKRIKKKQCVSVATTVANELQHHDEIMGIKGVDSTCPVVHFKDGLRIQVYMFDSRALLNHEEMWDVTHVKIKKDGKRETWGYKKLEELRYRRKFKPAVTKGIYNLIFNRDEDSYSVKRDRGVAIDGYWDHNERLLCDIFEYDAGDSDDKARAKAAANAKAEEYRNQK